MGKKARQASSLKTSKNIEKKQQFNSTSSSFIKVLRPKVYITDTSNFKRLVQELTGNIGSQINTSPVEQVPVIDIEEEENRMDQESSPEAAASFGSSELGKQVCFSEDDLKHSCNDQIYLPDMSYDVNQLQDIESWLLDAEPNSFYNGYGCQIEQEVSIYDYELSGLL